MTRKLLEMPEHLVQTDGCLTREVTGSEVETREDDLTILADRLQQGPVTLVKPYVRRWG